MTVEEVNMFFASSCN